ncbi:MAG: choice-of-anchor Q domain-containing protein [Acidobacteriota bacterium]
MPASLVPIHTSISNVNISNGSSTVAGGGIYSLYSDLTLNGISFTGNSSPNGSALYVGGSNLTITNSSFSDNTGTGAAIGYDTLSTTNFSLSNSTISGNSATGVRLGLGSSGSAEIISSTIASNSGGGVQVSGNGGRIVRLLGNILAGNSGTSLTASGSNTFGTQGYNLASDGGGGFLTGPGELINTDPLLAPLSDYGGTTPTRALLRGSPGVDAGPLTGSPALDQRGVGRVGRADLGAFESRGFQLAISGGDHQVAVTGSNFASQLAVTITAVDAGVPVTGGPVTFTPPASGASAIVAGSPATVSGSGAMTGTVTANATAGSYSVVAKTSGISSAVSFNLRNNIAPSVVSILRAGPSPTTSTSLSFTVTFSEAVTGLTVNNFALALVNAAGASISSVTGAGTTWTVTVATGGGTGQIGLNLVNSTGVADGDGAPLSNPPFTGEVYAIAPRVVSIVRSGGNPSTAANVGFNVTFSESVTGLGGSNFTVVANGLTGAGVTGVTGSGSSWIVTVGTGIGNGTLGLNLANSTGVVDGDGASLANLPFTGEVYTIAPTVLSMVRAGASPTGAASLSFTVTFSSSMTGGGSANYAVVGTGTISGTIVSVTGSGATRTVVVNLGSGSGTIALDLVDSTGLTSLAGIALANLPYSGPLYTIDRTPPETTITSGPPLITPVGTANFAFTGSDASGVSAYECRLDGLAYGPCTSPIVMTGMAPGLHSFEARAVDPFGNVDSTPARYDWTINSLPAINALTIELFAGAPGESRPIASVSDPDQPASSLLVSATLLNGAGVSIGNLTVDNAGRVLAFLQADCVAIESSYRLTVTDSLGGVSTTILRVQIRRQTASIQNSGRSEGGGVLAFNRRAIGASCTPPGPGLPPATPTGVSGLKPGSLLIFNLYTSSPSGDRGDSRFALTNTSPAAHTAINLFLVDGQTGAVAARVVELTPNQTVSMLASEIDPGTTGYLIAVAVDARGCPISFNHLIGEVLVRVESGHRTALAALGVAVIDPTALTGDPGALTVTLRFDGREYDELPRSLAVSSLPARRGGNETLLIINRVGGSLLDGATSPWSLAGLLFDDLERSASFAMAGVGCQLMGVLGPHFPRTSPRFESMIPVGRSGWMRLATTDDHPLTGAVINLAPDGFDRGRNLHHLTTTRTGVLSMPVLSH